MSSPAEQLKQLGRYDLTRVLGKPFPTGRKNGIATADAPVSFIGIGDFSDLIAVRVVELDFFAAMTDFSFKVAQR